MALVSSEHADFCIGSIKKIVLTNFMTHKYTVVHPSSRINLVMGANGSGKSSLVCALCLGLGGSPGDMRRSSDIKDFILNGATEASIEITLQGPGKNYVVTRQIKMSGSGRNASSIFKFDKNDGSGVQVVAESEYHELMLTLNIQMDNPTQFLPQELIGSFTEKTPTQLLTHTMSAVSQELAFEYKELVEANKKVGSSTKTIEALKREIAENEERLSKITGSVESFREYEKCDRKIRILEVQLLASQRDDLFEKHAKRRAEGHSSEDDFKRMNIELPQINAECDAAEAAAAAAKDVAFASKNSVAEARRSVNALTTQITEFSDKIAEKVADYSKLTGQEAQMRASVKKASDAVDAAKKKLAEAEARKKSLNAADVERAKAVGAKARAESDSLKTQAEGIEMEIRKQQRIVKDLGLQLQSLESLPQRRREFFFQKHGKLMGPCRVMDKARSEGRFKGSVLGPLLLDVEIVEPTGKFTNQVEHALESDWSRGFLALNRADNVAIASLDGFQGTVAVFSGDPQDELRKIPTDAFVEKLRASIGLTDLFCVASPKLIKCSPHALAHMIMKSQVQNKFATSDVRAIEKVMAYYASNRSSFPSREAGGWDFTSPTATVFCTSTETNRRPIEFPARILSIKVDRDAVEKAKGDLDAAQAALAAGLSQKEAIDVRMSSLAATEKSASALVVAWGDATRDLNRSRATLTSNEQKLAELEKSLESAAGLQLAQASALMEVRTLQIAQLNLSATAATATAAYRDATEADILALLNEKMLSNKSLNASEIRNELGRKIKNFKKREAEFVKELEAMQQDADKKNETFQQLRADLVDEDKQWLVQYLAQKPSNKELKEVEGAVEFERQKKALMNVDPTIKARYETLLKAIDTRKKELEDVTVNLDSKQLEHQGRIDNFLSRLRVVRDRLSDRFGKYMQSLGVKGDVKLVSEDSIATLGLSVRVSFREGAALAQLSTTQSGGERALATMMVLLAMQESTPLPFRLVDEINQGMSASNERAVMQTLAMLFDNVGKDGRPITTAGAAAPSVAAKQLFIVTPKLLPDLLHSPSMRSVIIFNGPHIAESKSIHNYFLDFSALANGIKFPSAQKGVGGAGAGAAISDDDIAIVEPTHVVPRKRKADAVIELDDDDDERPAKRR